MIERARRRIAKGIYKDQYGLAATVKVRGQQREKRFPPDTSIKTIKNWQGDTKAALAQAPPGDWPGDVRGRRRAVSRRAHARCRPTTNVLTHLALWCAEFGPRNRHTIETLEIDTVLSRWLDAGLLAVDCAQP